MLISTQPISPQPSGQPFDGPPLKDVFFSADLDSANLPSAQRAASVDVPLLNKDVFFFPAAAAEYSRACIGRGSAAGEYSRARITADFTGAAAGEYSRARITTDFTAAAEYSRACYDNYDDPPNLLDSSDDSDDDDLEREYPPLDDSWLEQKWQSYLADLRDDCQSESTRHAVAVDYAYSVDDFEEGPTRVYDSALLTALLPAALRGTLFVLDGASTCGVVEDERLCTDVCAADIFIKTGGQGKPNLVHCRKVGTLTLQQVVEGRTVVLKLKVRIVPGFGVNILPESYFLKKNFSVNKTGDTVRVLSPDNKLVLTGSACKHDTSWLFYVELTVVREAPEAVAITTDVAPIFDADWDTFVADTLGIDAGGTTVSASDVTLSPDVPVSFFTVADEGEMERCTLLPVTQLHDQVYAATMSRGPTVELIQLWHARYGHRNYRDVAIMLGIPLPANMPPCIECIMGKSKRQPLTGNDGIHEAPRPGYAVGGTMRAPSPPRPGVVPPTSASKSTCSRASFFRSGCALLARLPLSGKTSSSS